MFKTLAPGSIGHNVTLDVSAPMAAKYGFKGIWIDIVKESVRPVEETNRILEENHVIAAGFVLPVDYRDEESAYKRDMEKLEAYVKYAHDCGIKRCMTWILPASDKYSYEENFELHRIHLKKAAELLKKYNIRLGLEFVGPPKSRKGQKYEFIYNLDGMLKLCNAIGTGNLGIIMDVWHWDLAGQTYEDFAKFKDESDIVCVHINDAPVGAPEDEQDDLVRKLPGSTGVLRIEEFFKGLLELNYQGPVLTEPFEKELEKVSFEEAVKIVAEAEKKVWPKAEKP